MKKPKQTHQLAQKRHAKKLKRKYQKYEPAITGENVNLIQQDQVIQTKPNNNTDFV
jgi:hypothetical protein